MNEVQRLFGVKASEIKEDVIITPFLHVSYFAESGTAKKAKGFLFEVFTRQHYSIVKTGVGASFVGDAVTYLKETPCRRLYFIGSCAALSPYNVGDIVVADKALACESFTEILRAQMPDCSFVIPEQNLSDEFFAFCRQRGRHEKEIGAASAASLGSLSLQSRLITFLKKRGVGCVDMELSAFFSAANSLHLPCLGLLYVTDSMQHKPFYRTISSEERKVIKTSRQRAITLLCEFIRLR